MSSLICGSLAYDTIMVFEGHFKNHILANKVHMLNVSFLVPTLNRAFGGCAGNIAYNLKMLGGDPVPMAAVGLDFRPYRERLDHLGISRRHVLELKEYYTAQAYITTDLDDNQITAFHPGAMMESHRNKVSGTEGVTMGIVAPDGREAMIQHAREFAELEIPFIFDPGQALPLFEGGQLRTFIEQATWVTVNDYESEVVKKHTGWTEDEIADRVQAYIVTKGAEGSYIHTDAGQVIQIPAAKACQVADPTGCGDAYRGGLLYGLQQGFDWPTTGRIATLMGTYKVEQQGTQNHAFTLEEFKERFGEAFGYVF